MRRSRRAALVCGAFLLTSAAACAQHNRAATADTSARGGATVVQGADLVSRGGSLLEALKGRVSNMRVDRMQGRCPLITLRGQKTIIGSTDPTIYIDGTRMGDTCSLDQVQVVSVERVEVYAGGISPPPGYAPAANGTILVFLTGGMVRR
jgi:hypothetical protein